MYTSVQATNSLLVLMQHFAAHGSPHGRITAASFMGHGFVPSHDGGARAL